MEKLAKWDEVRRVRYTAEATVCQDGQFVWGHNVLTI